MSVRKREFKWRGDLECLEHRQLLSLTLNLVANDISPLQGKQFSGAVATLIDLNLTAQPSNFTVSIVWQNGQPPTSGTVARTSIPGTFEVDGSNTYPQVGTFNTQITVTDTSNNTAYAEGVANVRAQPLTILGNAISGVENTTLNNVVANFIDPSGALQTQFNALIGWGDGQSSPGMVQGGPNQFMVLGSHMYASPGTYTTTITVVGQGNVPGATATGTANIGFSTPPSIAITGQSVVTPAGQPLNNVVVATITDPVTTDTADLFTALISWGDGVASQGTVTGNSGNFTITGSHTYAAAGSFPIDISLASPAGETLSTTSTATVLNAGTNVNFTGGLANLIVNGPLAANGYTNTNRPTFSGTSAPFAIVQLYARYVNVDAELPLGEAVASANGQWTLTTGPLTRGVSVVTAVVTIPAGYPSTAMTLSNQNGTNLVYIDLAPAPVKRPPHRRVEAPHPKIHTSKPAMLKPHGLRHL